MIMIINSSPIGHKNHSDQVHGNKTRREGMRKSPVLLFWF